MTTIYALCAPDTGEIRYVGKTVWPLRRRLRSHVAEAAGGASRHRCNWIRSLSSPPVIRPLVVVPDSFASAMEMRTILHLRRTGHRLVNGTDGGEGAPGRRHTDEAKARVGAANRGRKPSAETRAKMSAAHLGRKFPPERTRLRGRKRPRTPEWQAKLTKALPRRPLAPEHRAKVSAGLRRSGRVWRRGWKMSHEQRAKISASLRGRSFTPEHRARISAALRAKARAASS